MAAALQRLAAGKGEKPQQRHTTNCLIWQRIHSLLDDLDEMDEADDGLSAPQATRLLGREGDALNPRARTGGCH